MIREARKIRSGDLKNPLLALSRIARSASSSPVAMEKRICAVSVAPILPKPSVIRVLVGKSDGRTRARVSHSPT